jgi:exodeoxyribonuclease VII small subunit
VRHAHQDKDGAHGAPYNRFADMPRKTTKKQPDFETSLAELESLVETLEQGDISLEESLKLFERGVTLTRSCQKSLKEAEQKVQILLDKTGEPEEFDSDE